MKLIFLYSVILGMVSNPRANQYNLACQLWLDNLLVNGVRVVLP